MKKTVNIYVTLVAFAFSSHVAEAQSRRDVEQTYTMPRPYAVKNVKPNESNKAPKNVILMIADGMSLAHMYSAWTANGGKLFMDKMPVTGLAKTYCADRLITDSGAAGTAIATGQKTLYHQVGVDVLGRPLPTLIDVAKQLGKKTAIAVTCRLNDATPADFCCHNADRNRSYAIVADYLDTDVDFVFGGGAEYFNNRPDGRDLFNELEDKGYYVARNFYQAMNTNASKVFAPIYDKDLPKPVVRGNMLSKASMKAINTVDNSKGFFAMIEGSQIDDYGHFNELPTLMEEIHDFDRTVGEVLKWAEKDGETLVIVTADHETGGLTMIDGDINTNTIKCKFSSGGHTGVMVPVFAYGPRAELFNGSYENTDIFHKINQAWDTQYERNVKVAVIADLHFDPLPETDQHVHPQALNKLDSIHSVVIAGDIFNTASKETQNLFRQRYERGFGNDGDSTLRLDIYPGYGNHDIDPTGKGNPGNQEGRELNLAFMDSTLNAMYDNGKILNLHRPSRSYSWNVEDVHFVMAQAYSGDDVYGESNLQWLAEDLKKYASKGEPVVYIQHYGVDPWAIKWWGDKERNHLFDILDQHNIAAFFVGHTHTLSIQEHRGYPIYQINNAWPDNSGTASFAIIEIKGDNVSIYSREWTDQKGGTKKIDAHQINSKLPTKK